MGANKEWIKSVISHASDQAVPYNFMFTPPAERMLVEHFGVSDIEQHLNLPMRMTGCNSPKPLYADPEKFGPGIIDEFGVTWSTSLIDRGSPVKKALAEPSLANYKMPDPCQEYRFDGLGRWCKANQQHFTVIWVGDLWERATFMRGMENILLDVALNRAFVEQLLEKLTDYILRTMEILFERFDFDAVAISDDYGTQQSTIISPEDWRKLIKPNLAKIYTLAKKNNRYIFHHSCGNNTAIIADMIDIGLDIIHPVQPEAMDLVFLKRRFGSNLTFCGGLNTQQILPCATADEIVAEVRRLKQALGKNGGYIFEPGITVQADVPLGNILAMIGEAAGRSE